MRRNTVNQSIVTLQVMRGIAAVAVAFYHVYIIMMETQYGANVVFRPIARHGFLGVSFFFVLSGFIIFMAHRRDIGNLQRIPVYAYKRAVRVYPAYWVYLTLFISAAAFGLGYPDFSWAPANLLSSYLLVPLVSDMSLPLKVAWTLVYEIRFYALFLLILAFGMRGLWLFVIWAIAIVISFLGGFQEIPDVLSLWNLYFLAGMVGFLLLDRVPPSLGPAIFLAGAALMVVYATIGDDILRIAHLDERSPGLHFVLVPAFLALILGAALTEWAYDLQFPRLLVFLGDASYSVYLVHSACISLIVLIGHRAGLIEAMGVQVFFLITFVLAITGGVVAYLVVEKPLIKLSRMMLKRYQRA